MRITVSHVNAIRTLIANGAHMKEILSDPRLRDITEEEVLRHAPPGSLHDKPFRVQESEPEPEAEPEPETEPEPEAEPPPGPKRRTRSR